MATQALERQLVLPGRFGGRRWLVRRNFWRLRQMNEPIAPHVYFVKNKLFLFSKERFHIISFKVPTFITHGTNRRISRTFLNQFERRPATAHLPRSADV